MTHAWHDVTPGATFARRIHGRHRNSDGLQRQVRARQGNRPASARPHPLFRGLLSRQLRLHPADAWPRTTIRSTCLVLCQEPVAPLTLVSARTIGLMTMMDSGKKDHKILAVAAHDPEYNGFHEADELAARIVSNMLRRFFQDYKTARRQSRRGRRPAAMCGRLARCGRRPARYSAAAEGVQFV